MGAFHPKHTKESRREVWLQCKTDLQSCFRTIRSPITCIFSASLPTLGTMHNNKPQGTKPPAVIHQPATVSTNSNSLICWWITNQYLQLSNHTWSHLPVDVVARSEIKKPVKKMAPSYRRTKKCWEFLKLRHNTSWIYVQCFGSFVRCLCDVVHSLQLVC